MAEATGTLTYWDLIEDVRDFLGYDSALGGDDLARVRRLIESGYRMFLNPPPIPPSKYGYAWSFLSPATTLAVVADDYAYDLPDDFGAMEGVFTYATGITSVQFSMVGEGRIRALRAGSDSSSSPHMFAIRPKVTVAGSSTRWEVILWPTPQTTYTLHYRYRVQQSKLGTARVSGTDGVISGASYTILTDDGADFVTGAVVVGDRVILKNASGPTEGIYYVSTIDSATQITLTGGTDDDGDTEYEIIPEVVYPLGGALFSETVRRACLAVADVEIEGRADRHMQMFMLELAGAIGRDLEQGPQTLGYVGDPGDDGETDSRVRDLYYNGTIVPGG